jgi:hypothetical protein
MNQGILIGIGILVAITFYFLARGSGTSPAAEYEHEIEKILNSDENRVKGRFE